MNKDDLPAVLSFNEIRVFIKPIPDINRDVLNNNNPIEKKIFLNCFKGNVFKLKKECFIILCDTLIFLLHIHIMNTKLFYNLNTIIYYIHKQLFN